MGKAQSSFCSGEPGPPSFIPRVKWSSDEHSSSSGIPYKTFSFRDWPWGLLLASFSVNFLLAGGEWVSYALSFGNALLLLDQEGSNEERTSTLSHRPRCGPVALEGASAHCSILLVPRVIPSHLPSAYK